jgi:hypothetical protein
MRDDRTLSLLAVGNRLTYSYDFTVEERDGVRYQVTKNAKAVVEPSGARYNMTNLFNGDRLLGKAPCIMHSELATSTICTYTGCWVRHRAYCTQNWRPVPSAHIQDISAILNLTIEINYTLRPGPAVTPLASYSGRPGPVLSTIASYSGVPPSNTSGYRLYGLTDLLAGTALTLVDKTPEYRSNNRASPSIVMK